MNFYPSVRKKKKIIQNALTFSRSEVFDKLSKMRCFIALQQNPHNIFKQARQRERKLSQRQKRRAKTPREERRRSGGSRGKEKLFILKDSLFTQNHRFPSTGPPPITKVEKAQEKKKKPSPFSFTRAGERFPKQKTKTKIFLPPPEIVV